MRVKKIRAILHDLILEGTFYFAGVMLFYSIMWYLFFTPHWIALAISIGCTIYIALYIYANAFYNKEV